MTEPLVEVRGLVNRFGTQIVHDGLEMTVERGEVFGIVGGSGSGKSVLLRSILGLQHPQGGEVRLQGRVLNRLSVGELRKMKASYGVTFQQGALFTSLTVLQNVQLPMLEHLQLSARALDELAMLKVRLVGLPDEAARKYPAQLSGGMIKRAALARAIVMRPTILLCDEPFSGLDPVSARRIEALLTTINQRFGMTVVVVSHDIPSTMRMASRVLVLMPGGAVEDTPEALEASGDPRVAAFLHPDVEAALREEAGPVEVAPGGAAW
jgi:phospholipid/cholesterol/gamma-HCH transport system ATP-binding protein